MIDPKVKLDAMRRIIIELQNPHLKVSEKAGLYAAACFICQDFNEFFSGTDQQGYAKERLSNLKTSIAAIADYDSDNGYDTEFHIKWALGQLGTLQELVTDASGDIEL